MGTNIALWIVVGIAIIAAIHAVMEEKRERDENMFRYKPKNDSTHTDTDAQSELSPNTLYDRVIREMDMEKEMEENVLVVKNDIHTESGVMTEPVAEEQTATTLPPQNSNNNTQISTRSNNEAESDRLLILRALRTLGCQPQIINETEIKVGYQGLYFQLKNINNHLLRAALPCAILHTTLDPHIDFMHEAINTINYCYHGIKITTSMPDENKDIYLDCIYDSRLNPADFEDLTLYIKEMLDTLIFSRDELLRCYYSLLYEHEQECERERYIPHLNNNRTIN